MVDTERPRAGLHEAAFEIVTSSPSALREPCMRRRGDNEIICRAGRPEGIGFGLEQLAFIVSGGYRRLPAGRGGHRSLSVAYGRRDARMYAQKLDSRSEKARFKAMLDVAARNTIGAVQIRRPAPFLFLPLSSATMSWRRIRH